MEAKEESFCFQHDHWRFYDARSHSLLVDNSDDSRFDDAGAKTLRTDIGAVRWMACVLESF